MKADLLRKDSENFLSGMGQLLKNILIAGAAIVVLGGCATVKNHDSLAYVPNSALSNINPAPANMSPPDVTNAANDPTHMRTQADYHYSLGEAYSLSGNSAKAIEEFKLTTIYDPKSATVRLRLAAEYLRQGLLTEAVEQAETAKKLDPANNDVHMFLGGLYQALKMYVQSEVEYKAVLAKNPNDSEALIYLGGLSAEQEQYDTAEQYFVKAAHVHGSDKGQIAYYYLGKMQMSRGDDFYKKAQAAFEHSLEIKPDYEDSAIALADLYAAEGDNKKGTKLLESFEEQFGPKKAVAYQLSQTYLEKEDYDHALKHLLVLEGFEPDDVNVKVKIALILIEKKKYDEAIQKLEQIIAMAPGSNKIRFYLGAVYEEINQFQLAISNYEKIDSASTFYGDAIVHAAYLLRKQNDDKAAAQLLEKALAKRDDLPQFYAFYASMLDDKHEYQKGISLLEQGVKKFPDNTQLRFYLGSMYDHVGRTNDTISEMKKILALDSDYVQALNYLAYTYAEQGKNLDQAEVMARKAMDLQPNDPYILDTVGWVLFKKGRVEDAIQYLETAYKLKNDESVIAEHLGDAYYVFELTDKAKAMYEKAASIESDPKRESEIKAKIISLEAGQKDRTPASASAASSVQLLKSVQVPK